MVVPRDGSRCWGYLANPDLCGLERPLGLGAVSFNSIGKRLYLAGRNKGSLSLDSVILKDSRLVLYLRPFEIDFEIRDSALGRGIES